MMKASRFRSPAVPYVVPFVVFLGFLALPKVLPLPELTDQIVRVAGMTLTLVLVARPAIDLRVNRALGSILLGVAVFVLWIAPDLLIPGYRQHWLFENPIMGLAGAALEAGAPDQPPGPLPATAPAGGAGPALGGAVRGGG